MRGTKAEINLNNLEHNLNILKKSAPDSEIFSVVKANAYGHGIIKISQHLRKLGVNTLAVAFAEEAIKIRNSGDTGEILLIVSGNKDEADAVAEYNLQTIISDTEMLEHYNNAGKKFNKIVPLHLFINTGMNRDGINYFKAVEFMQLSQKYSNIKIVGLLTHFSTSEFEDTSFADMQLNRFEVTRKSLEDSGFNFKYIHTANSGGIINVKNSHYNAVRPGISMYGYMPSRELNDRVDLKPVLSLKSKVLLIKDIDENEVVGYSKKYITDKKTKIAIIAIGYGDGYTTRLTNKGKCIINSKKFNIIGSVCMDQLMVDVRNDDVRVGDEVTLIGKQGDEEISIYDIAELSGLIPYEIFTLLTERLPRHYIDE